MKIPAEYLLKPKEELENRVREIKGKLGEDLLIICHHYQKDEVYQFADVTGDSLYLAQEAQKNKKSKYIVFCGVHFMAETADMLTEDWQKVYLPDEAAGCFMADMANGEELRDAWGILTKKYGNTILPITYVNSTAEVKAFVGEHGGVCVTSTNAPKIVKWALEQKQRILFLPDQHLGRNTTFELGIPLEQMSLWDRVNKIEKGAQDSKVILWNGYCSVHQQFTMANVDKIRKDHPETKIIVHPECQFDVVQAADQSGSTNKLLKIVDEAPEGSSFAVGTDNNLVDRLTRKYAGKKEVMRLNQISCACVTMNRIKLPHLVWNLENILAGSDIQRITVDRATKESALKSLEKMMELS
ncbi:MAG: quinolinate synthase NadA [Candidatus Ancillula sp.]|nr:quinolinate synthase NadA [Candidatus Ancillula sp.]